MTDPLDIDGATALARWLQEQGNEGLVIAGTTGEAPTLTDPEKLALWEAVAEAVTIPVLAGSTDADTAHSVHLTAEASKLGIAGVLALCPYYNRPSQAGIEGHLRAIADATDLPVVIYDIPVRTGRKISTELLARLAHEVDNIVGVKDAAGNPAETARLVAVTPSAYEVYSGDDAMTLPLLAVGACRPHRRGHPLGRARRRGDVRSMGRRRPRRCPRRPRPPARELGVRDRRRCAEPRSGEGDAATPRPTGRVLPPADGR